jgi:hypothetical protein
MVGMEVVFEVEGFKVARFVHHVRAVVQVLFAGSWGVYCVYMCMYGCMVTVILIGCGEGLMAVVVMVIVGIAVVVMVVVVGVEGRSRCA